MLRGMSGKTWREWQWYMRLHPSLDYRIQYWVGQIVKALWDTTVAQLTRGKKTSSKRNLYDFINEIRFGDQDQERPPPPRRAGPDIGLKLHQLFEIIRTTKPRD